MKNKTLHLQDFIGLLNRFYPPDLAEEWDNTGLQVGEPDSVIQRIMLALDPSMENLLSAHTQQCQLLLTHHPLIFKPLKQISTADPTGKTITHALRHKINIACAHTNLDSASNGLNDWLATTLHLNATQVLQPSKHERFFKLVVYTPHTHKETLLQALFRGGAGHIGQYDQCAFCIEGHGQFRPGSQSNPFLGTQGQEQIVEETRIETVVPQRNIHKVLKHMYRAHPYEEVAYDLFELHNQTNSTGLGRIGKLSEVTTLEAFAHKCKEQLNCTNIRIVGHVDAPVRTVAVCGGSGSSTLYAAKFSGADVLVTGDLKYHEAQSAVDLGICVIDAGHFATEILATKGLQNTLTTALEQRGFTPEIIIAPDEHDPFTFI